MKTNSIKWNALANITNTIANIIIPLITYPYVTRVLSATGMGKVSFFTSLADYAVMIAALGISTYGIRSVANVRDDRDELSKVTSELFFINLVMSLILVAILFVLYRFVPQFNSEPVLFLICCGTIIVSPFGINWFYSGLEQYAYVTKRNILFKIISLILIFIFVNSTDSYPVYALILSFSLWGSYIINFIYSRRFASISLHKKMSIKRHIAPMLLLFSSILAVSVYSSLDTVMLGFICDNKEVGLYTIAVKIKWILLSAVNAVSAVLLPRLSYYIKNRENKKYTSTLKKSISFTMLVTIPLSVFFIVKAKDCIYLLGGRGYIDAVPCMQVLMPILVLSGISSITGNQILLPKGHDKQFLNAVIVGAIADVILNFLLMPKFGCVGAAIATLIAEMIQMVIQVYYSMAVLIKAVDIKNVGKTILASVLPSIILIKINGIFSVNSLLSLILSAIIFFGIYGVILIVEKEKLISEYILQLLIRRKKQ